MPRLYMITVPGLEVKSDWHTVHDRLLDDFPKVDDVLPTTTPETLLIVYRGRDQADKWLEAVSEGVLLRRMGVGGARACPARVQAIRPLISEGQTRKGIPA